MLGLRLSYARLFQLIFTRFPHLHHQIPVLLHITHVTYTPLLIILTFQKHRHGRNLRQGQILHLPCWYLYHRVWCTCTSPVPSKGCITWSWWNNMTLLDRDFFGGLLVALVWIYHIYGGFWNVIYVVYYYLMYYFIVILYFPFYFSLNPELYHNSLYLNCTVLDWYKWFNEVVGVVGHTCGGVVTRAYDEGFILHFELKRFITYPFISIFWWRSTFLEDLDYLLAVIVSNNWLLYFISLCVVPWAVPVSFCSLMYVLVYIVGFVRLDTIFYPLPNIYCRPFKYFLCLVLFPYPSYSFVSYDDGCLPNYGYDDIVYLKHG